LFGKVWTCGMSVRHDRVDMSKKALATGIGRRPAGAARSLGSLSADEILSGLRSGDRIMLARAITLVESGHPRHQETARELVRRCAGARTGDVLRIGISGAPGAGKSTFIDELGMAMCHRGHRVAVLTVDPSSVLTGGSILADKTRMNQLAKHEAAFVRSSPSRGSLGGVAGASREAALLCEAAGYDRIIIETVGVGQSETAVRSMVDFFLLLQLAGGGDELQCIKKGIVEIVDAIAVTKADGENTEPARQAAMDIRRVMRILAPYTEGWTPPVIHCSAFTKLGLDEVLSALDRFESMMKKTGRLGEKRKDQETEWMETVVRERIVHQVLSDERMRRRLEDFGNEIRAGRITASSACEELLSEVEIKVRPQGRSS